MIVKRADLVGVTAITIVIVVFIALLLLEFSLGNLGGILVPALIIAALSEAFSRYRRMRNRKKNRSNDL